MLLLSETAAKFFERRGYQVIERGAAPPDVQASAEFLLALPQLGGLHGKGTHVVDRFRAACAD